MIQILPAILSNTAQQYKSDIEKLSRSGSFKKGWVHIDFMDNKFVPNQSIDPEIVTKYPTNLKKEAHLMVDEPVEWIEKLADAGFDRVLIHFEAKKVTQAVDLARKSGMEVGIALKNETSIDKVEPLVGKIDMVLIMGVEPGFQGQPFLEGSVWKIKQVKENGWNVKVAVDGAVRDSNVKNLVEAGVDQLDIGSFLLKGDIDENVEKIWEAIKSS